MMTKPEHVIEATRNFFSVEPHMFAAARHKICMDARAVASHIMREHLLMTYPDIEFAIRGTHHHSSSIYACRRYKQHETYTAQGRIYAKHEAKRKILEMIEELKEIEQVRQKQPNGITPAESQAMAMVCRVAGKIGWQTAAAHLNNAVYGDLKCINVIEK